MTDVNESIKPVEKPKRRAVGGQSLGARGIYLLPNLFTSAALFAGFFVIVQAMNSHFEQAAMAIFIAMVLDGLDGRVARMTNTQSAFGAEYDSLSDMVSFGVAPALILYVWALKPLGKLGWLAAFLYCACLLCAWPDLTPNWTTITKINAISKACPAQVPLLCWQVLYGFHTNTG